MTMMVAEALSVLGAKRVIWIDDRFNETPEQLAKLLTRSLEITKACAFPELEAVLEAYEIDPTGGLPAVTQIFADLSPDRIEEMRTAFFAHEQAEKEAELPTTELSADVIDNACALLGIAPEDRWTFGKADRELPGLCEAGDAELSYIVDLNESGGSPKRGLDALRALWTGKSQGAAFVLTHETGIASEATIEKALRDDLKEEFGGLGLPVCVIAKERLTEKAGDPEGLAEALRVGVKRAGLRRSLHQVLAGARDRLQTAIDEAAERLLSIPPERLESHVYERGYKEGVSELHVVERAITAHIGQEARGAFGDAQAQASLRRLRALRAIQLQSGAAGPDDHLASFREAEVWEAEDLLNRALTPIACGDVFELDPDEPATKASKQKFILLGQPCDISLRPEGSPRAQDTAFLIPLKVKALGSAENPKVPLLPFTLRGEQWACDFRNGSVARLSILDLASFRTDGRVRVDNGQAAPTALLVGQQKVYDERTNPASSALADPKLRPAAGQIAINLQLTFATTEMFKHIHSPVFEEASKQKAHGVTTERPKRATWRLRRCGRVRMPYAAALLDLYTSVMSRHAFDLDFMSPAGGPPVAPAPSEPPANESPAGDNDLKSTRRRAS